MGWVGSPAYNYNAWYIIQKNLCLIN